MTCRPQAGGGIPVPRGPRSRGRAASARNWARFKEMIRWSEVGCASGSISGCDGPAIRKTETLPLVTNVSSCQAASLIAGSDKFHSNQVLLPADLLVGTEGVEGSWRESGGEGKKKGIIGRYGTISPLNGHTVIWMAEEFVIWENERCLIPLLESRARYQYPLHPASFSLEV